MSILGIGRLLCSRIQVACLKQWHPPSSAARETFGIPKWSGNLNPLRCYSSGSYHYSTRMPTNPSSSSSSSFARISVPHPPVVLIPTRGVVNFSKRRGKKKTVKAVAKRFHRTGSGKLKYWPAGKVHNMLCKSRNHRRRLRKPRYANKTQLKTLNKMISGW